MTALGAAAGNMNRHNVVAASAIVGLLGREGEVLSKTIIPMIDYFTIAGLIGIVFV